jgi:hypothetical protein
MFSRHEASAAAGRRARCVFPWRVPLPAGWLYASPTANGGDYDGVG